MPSNQTLSDDSFLEMRWRCLSLAADFDRAQRAGVERSDPRFVKLREALGVLLADDANRAERVQMIFSDKTPPPPYGKAARR